MVYDRLQIDKQNLQNILDKIDEWNNEHQLMIDNTPVTDLMQQIDEALNNFNTQVADIAEEVRQYSEIVKENIPMKIITSLSN